MKRYSAALLIATFLSGSVIASANPDGRALFNSTCTMCHGIDQGKLGPAVRSMSTDPEVLRIAITRGRNAMPGYGRKMKAAEIDALVDYLLANQ